CSFKSPSSRQTASYPLSSTRGPSEALGFSPRSASRSRFWPTPSSRSTDGRGTSVCASTAPLRGGRGLVRVRRPGRPLHLHHHLRLAQVRAQLHPPGTPALARALGSQSREKATPSS